MSVSSEWPRLLRASRYEGESHVRPHSHEGPELVLVTEGRCAVTIGETVLEGAAGTLFVFPANRPHDQRNMGMVTTSYVRFMPVPGFDDRFRVLKADKWIAAWMNELCMISDAVLANLDALAGGIIHSILQRIDQIEQRNDATRHLHPGLAGALVFIEHEFARPFRLADVARHAGLSPSHLSALFRAEFECSPMAYGMGVRMRLAKALLDDPHLSVKEVGVRCGFRDTNYFCRAFRRFHGQSPGVCRRA